MQSAPAEATIADRFGEPEPEPTQDADGGYQFATSAGAAAMPSSDKVRLLPLSQVGRRVRRSWGIHTTGDMLARLYLFLPPAEEPARPLD